MTGLKTRLLFVFSMSAAVAVTVGLVVSFPFIWLIRDRLHLGCGVSHMEGASSWTCPDGLAYAAPGLGLVALIGTVALIIGIRREFHRDDETTRATAARILAVLVAIPLVAQAVVSLPAVVLGDYDAGAICVGSGLFVVGLVVILLRKRTVRIFVAACTLGIIVSLGAVFRAPLALPFLIAVAAVLGAAAVLRLPMKKAVSSPRAVP